MRMIKRLIALIALASSAALAQERPGDGNVPAPDLFDGQIQCSSRLPNMPPTPSVVAMGAMESDLDAAIGMGTARITGSVLVNALGYVVPPMGSNCGQGIGQLAFRVANQGSIATDVAEGYSEVLPKFMVVYGDPDNTASTGTAGALERARAALGRAEADDTTTSFRLETLRKTLSDAQLADTKARSEYNAIAQGPIYQAAAAEWMAKAAVKQSVADYNSAVVEANNAQSVLDTMNYADYVPLGNSELIGSVVVIFDGMATINYAALGQYANSRGDRVAEANSNGVWSTSQSNFDAAGNLVVPNRLSNGELEAITRTEAVAVARRNADNHNIALAALKELKEDNLNIVLQPIIDESVRRAQAEADYYNRQLQNTLADGTNQNRVTVDNLSTPENEAAPFSIASRNADHVRASNGRVTAETALRGAAAAREAATQNVIDAFQNPDSFYAQLLARRQALQFFAAKAVADATTPSMALTDAAAAAAEAVVEAEAAQAAYQALVGDLDDPDNPVVDLIDTLLETDGDDGRALVDAISKTYDKTVENRDSIEALTADTEDGAEADGPITANAKAIATNTGEIESLGGRVTQNEQDIGTLMEDTDMNAAMISTNAGHIVTNAGNIAGNASNIVTNNGLISRNTGTIAVNSSLIDRNAGHIAVNSGRIGANTAAIGLNTGMIADNRHLIGELSQDLDIVRAGVAASIALSRMPSIDGGGISFGAGTFGGEMAYAVGFQVERGFGSFDIGVTSSGGEIGAGVGVGVKLWH